MSKMYRLIHTIPTSAAEPTAASALVAIKVFETTELMEAILLLLDGQTILAAMKVNQAVRDTVIGSIKLQKAVGLLPDWDAHFVDLLWSVRPREYVPEPKEYLPEKMFHGFMVSTSDQVFPVIDLVSSEFCAEIRLKTYKESSDSLTRLGSRCGSLSSCQPPLTMVDVFLKCGHCYGARRAKRVGTVSPSNGEYITMSDIHWKNIEVRVAHRAKCVLPTSRSAVAVEFVGYVRLREGDPIMLRHGGR